MPTVHSASVPACALSVSYQATGAFTDCYYIDVPMDVSLADLIGAFYTTPLFKLERAILAMVCRKPATDEHAVQLAEGRLTSFSIWTVETRQAQQILLREFTGSTRSWLMVEPAEHHQGTRLYFGSVVVPRKKDNHGEPVFGVLFHLLGGFHRVYSRGLLSFAARSLLKG